MKLYVKNFRSIKDQKIELAPITVVYGPNASGKSSVLYAVLTLKNLVLNPNQNVDGFFNYGFASLGSFEAVVFDHQIRNDIVLGISLEKDDINVTYEVVIQEKAGSFTLNVAGRNALTVKLQLTVAFPYPLNQQTKESVKSGETSFDVTWNGVTAQVQAPQGAGQEVLEQANQLAVALNAPIETLRRLALVPLKRGFSKPHYSSVALSSMMTEDELATLLSTDKYLVSRVSFYLEQMLEHDFRLNFKPGTAIFSLDSTDKKTGVASELVNDGFGINQLVYFLARSLHRDNDWVCVEEPEIHLHPTAVRGIAKVLTHLIHEENKRFTISTHSETFLVTLLTLVADGQLKASDLACYFARKIKKSTEFELQTVNEKGQIEGGLSTFIEAEMHDIKSFLDADK